MYGIYANIWGILMVNVTIYSCTMDPMGMISKLDIHRVRFFFTGQARMLMFHCLVPSKSELWRYFLGTCIYIHITIVRHI